MFKKLLLLVLAVAPLSLCAQKFAHFDYTLVVQSMPEAKTAQSELEALYKQYRTGLENMQKEREQAIVAKEKEAADLKKKYFGPEGELYKKRQSLVEPIQEEIYNAVKAIATAKGFQLILDRASDSAIVFASPAIDISNEVLAKLGYSK